MWTLPLLIVGLTVALSVPVGFYLAYVMDGRLRVPGMAWAEARLDTGPQTWKQYALSLILFSGVMFAFAFVVLAAQSLLPLNPDGKTALAPTTVFNTVASFLTNTNLQHYAGEQHLSYFSQLAVIAWNMFVSAAVGFCTLAAVVRGLRGDTNMGNFYRDLWRVVAFVFLPASLVMGVVLMADGMPMTFAGAVDGIARGPVAAVIPIKHLGTNGGGFFGANSAHPFENPSALSNAFTCINILIFPFSLVVMFGRMLGQMRQAIVIYGVMLVAFVVMIGWAVYFDAEVPNPAFAGLPVASAGNLEGKELRFGPSAGPTFAAVTTAVTCGSVNCMHDSLNPLAGLTPLTGMWLNCVFGGKGVGLVNMLVYLIVGVFLSGLMVGRTPEYLGKKVEVREMKLAMLALLCHPILVLGPTGLFAAFDWGAKSTANPGPHGFSEILYEFSSASANNGSGFEGLADTYGANNNPSPAAYAPHWDIATGLVMLIGRFVPIVAPLALVGGLAAKKRTPFTVGTLRTDTVTFGVVLLGTVVLVGALLFLPAAVLGPVADHFGPIPFGR